MHRASTAAAVLLSLLAYACTNSPKGASDPDYVVLVPDWKNDVVHRISRDGEYEGDFLDAGRSGDATAPRTLWAKPLGLLYVAGSPAHFWMTTGRAIGEWDARGRFSRTIVNDTTVLENPTCMIAVGDEIFVASADTKDMQVFGPDGTRRRKFGYPEFGRANDCKVGPDGLIYVGSTLGNAATPGLVTIWDPKDTAEDAKPRGYRIPGDLSEDGTYWVQGLAFDDDGKLLITEFARGRLERWDLATNKRVEVLLDSDQPGAYAKLGRGPDGLIYLAGADALYRFDSRAKADDLKNLEPFFDARQLAGRYPQPFSPTGISFAPRTVVDDKNESPRARAERASTRNDSHHAAGYERSDAK